MSKIYVGQNKLRITLTGNVDITSSTPYIQYRKPDGTTGSWAGTIQTAATGVVYYELVETTELNIAGIWTVWLYVVFSDSRVAYGEPYKFIVYDPGS